MLHVNTSTSNPPCKVTYKIIIIIILRSLVPRERILIWFRRLCRCEKSRFLWTANWPPLQVFAGALGLVLVSICHVMLVLFFFELVFNFDCIRQKGECSPNAAWDENFWSGENKLHHRKARVQETICSRSLVSRSFSSGPSVTCLVRM